MANIIGFQLHDNHLVLMKKDNTIHIYTLFEFNVWNLANKIPENTTITEDNEKVTDIRWKITKDLKNKKLYLEILVNHKYYYNFNYFNCDSSTYYDIGLSRSYICHDLESIVSTKISVMIQDNDCFDINLHYPKTCQDKYILLGTFLNSYIKDPVTHKFKINKLDYPIFHLYGQYCYVDSIEFEIMISRGHIESINLTFKLSDGKIVIF